MVNFQFSILVFKKLGDAFANLAVLETYSQFITNYNQGIRIVSGKDK